MLLSRYEWGANILRLLKEDPTNYDGGSLYRELSNKLRVEGADPDENAYGKQVAKELTEFGIKGVKYRGDKGTTNYVAFNDADIEITAGVGEAFKETQGEQTQIAIDGLVEVVKSNEATVPGSLAPDSNVDGAVDLTDRADGLAFDSLTFGISPKLVLNAYPQMDEFLAEQMMSETSTIGAIHIDRAGIGEIDGIPIQGGMLYPAIKENFKKGIGWAFNSISVANDVLSRARANNGYIKLILMTEGNVVGNKTFALIWSNRLKKVLNTKEKLNTFIEEFHKVREAAIQSKVTNQRQKEKKASAEAKKNGETPKAPLAEKDIAAYDRKGANIKTFNQFQKFLLGMSQTARASYYLKRGTQSTDTANRKKGQTIYGKLLGEKIVKKHGWPDPVELVTAMEDPAFKGMKKGDVVGFIKIDPDSTIMTAEEAGVPEHLSYGYVVKGKPYARAKNIRNIEDDYPSIAGQLMAQGAKDYPVSDYATFSIKEVTKQDEEYLQALKDKDFAKAEAMVLQEAKKKGGFKVYHGSWEHRKIAQADRFKPGGYASSRVVYFTDEENRQLSKDFGIVREYFYFPTNRIADIRSKSDTPELRKLIKQFNERGGYGVLDGSHRKKRYGKDFVKGYDPTWELLDDEDYVNAADFLFDGTYDAIQVDEDFAENNELGYDRDAIAIIDTSKIKSADLVTFDQKGKVIPLSQRFNMGVDNLTFSIVEKSQQQNILRAVDRLFGNSQNALEVGLKMQDRLDQVRQRYENLKYRKDFKGEKATREDQIFNALMQINAIASVLPPEVRKKVGSPLPVVTRKTDKGIEKQLQEKLEKVSTALDFYLQRKLRRKIKDVLKKSEAKVSKTGRKESKIGTFGHRIADYAKSVMEMTLEQAEAETQSLNDKFNDIENPELEDYENWDAKTLAVDLLYDFDNATTARLEKAYDFLQLNYKANRKEWLETLQKRKEEKDKWVDEAISFMGAKFKPGDKQKAAKMAKSAKGFWGGFLTQWLSSGHHILSRIVENAKDKQQARLWLYQLLDSRIRSEVDTDAETHDKKEKLYAKLAEILGAEGPTTGHQVRKFLAEALKNKETNITVLSGASKETVKVRLDEVEDILNGEKDAADGRDFTAEDLYALERAYERILDKPEQVPSHVTFERIISEGRRQLLDETSEGERVGLSYANALQYWLTLRQPDQAEKLAEMGWDEVTKQELDEFLPDEIKEIGVWMSDQLVADGVSINAKHAEEYGVDLAMHDFYWPVRNVVAGKEADISTDGTGPNRGMSSGALKERVRNRAEPAIVNAFSVYFQHTAEMAYWKNNISWFRKFGGAIRTEKFATNFKNSVGEKAYRDLNAYLQTIENRGANLRTEMSDMENLIRSMSSRFSLGVLGARISTMWINATSFVNPLASPDVSPVRIIRNAIGMMVDGNGALKATWRNELSVLRRKYGASFEAQLAMKSGNAGPVIIQDAEKLAQLGMLPMNYIDVGMGSVTFAAIYKEYYDAAIKRGDSEQVARSEADRAVTRSQAMLAQPSLGVSRSLQEQKAAGNVFMTLVTMFMSEVRKNAANNYMAWRALLTGKGIVDRPTAARQAFVYSIINTAVVQGFRSIYQFATGSDEEDKELEEQLRDPAFWTYTVLAENARAVPVLSDALLMAVAKPLDQKYWAQRSPFVGITQKLTQAGKIWDDSLTDSERLDSLLDQMQAAGSLFLGGPIIAEAANVGEFVKDIYTNGLGQDLSKKDQIKRLSKEIMANRKDVYEKFEDSEDRIPLMIDVLEQYQSEFPDQFPLILDELKARDAETGEVKTLKSGATEYKLPQEIMKHFVD